MINWEKVRAYFCLKYEIFTDSEVPLNDTLYCLLDFFYNVEKLSWRQIAEITDDYVSYTTLKNKAKQLGIKSRSKGGPHYLKTIPLTKEEYQTLTNTGLAKKYKVCRQTILKMAKEKSWPLKKAGKVKGGDE